jgi:hypothetical protein
MANGGVAIAEGLRGLATGLLGPGSAGERT